MDNTLEKSFRLHVYLAKCGIGSRRSCEKYIAQGRVAVNGKVISTPGTKYHLGDLVTFDGNQMIQINTKYYLALNKPPGYLCANKDPYGRPLAGDLLGNKYPGIFHVGRLDYQSRGLIFYTNDGDFAKKVTHPSSNIEKEYEVTFTKKINIDILDNFTSGITINGVTYRLLKYQMLSARMVQLVLLEGKNREIRTVFSHFHYHITSLRRTRIASISLDGIPEGSYRELKNREIKNLL